MRKIYELKEKKNSSIECLGDIKFYDDGKIGADINYSSLLTRLIIEAGKRCKLYASDLFASWESLLIKIFEMTEENNSFSEYFGFREVNTHD